MHILASAECASIHDRSRGNAAPADVGPSMTAFDAMAQDYDATFSDTAVGKALRDIVWSHLDDTFAPSQHVLDLGCGTGEDALHLARAGIRVTATDSSAEMIAVAEQKLRHRINGASGALPVELAVEFHCLPIERVADTFGPRSFAGAFS